MKLDSLLYQVVSASPTGTTALSAEDAAFARRAGVDAIEQSVMRSH